MSVYENGSNVIWNVHRLCNYWIYIV